MKICRTSYSPERFQNSFITKWRPCVGQKTSGRPQMRWSDDIYIQAGFGRKVHRGEQNGDRIGRPISTNGFKRVRRRRLLHHLQPLEKYQKVSDLEPPVIENHYRCFSDRSSCYRSKPLNLI